MPVMPTPHTRVLLERYHKDPEFHALCKLRAAALGRREVRPYDMEEVSLFYDMLNALNLYVASTKPRNREPSLFEYALGHQKSHPMCFKGLNDSYGFKLIKGGVRCLRCGTDVLRHEADQQPEAAGFRFPHGITHAAQQ